MVLSLKLLFYFKWSKGCSSHETAAVIDLFMKVQTFLSREESSLVDVFILEILANYLESLSLAHNDDQARGKIAEMTSSVQG